VRDALVAELSRSYGVHAYAKWGGAFWRLLALVDLGVGSGHRGAVAAAEETLQWVASPRRLAEIHGRRIDGRVRRCASQDGRALQACLDIGLRGESRLDTLAESLVDTQWPDGGWNCDRRPSVTHSSFNESWGPILGLAKYGAVDAVARGAEFLLRHRVVFSHRTGEPAHPVMLKLHFPAYWHYDLLAGLRTIAASDRLSDPRAADALDLLEEKRRADGTWRTQGRWWKRPGSKGSNVEVVDWGDAANAVLTEQAEGVLRVAGRL
jgi:predicted NUDIX family NTP pyrophosphohydrolase